MRYEKEKGRKKKINYIRSVTSDTGKISVLFFVCKINLYKEIKGKSGEINGNKVQFLFSCENAEIMEKENV